MLGRGILDDVEDARFTIAHELGHVARGHVERRTTYWTFGLLAGSAGVVLLVLAVTGVTTRGVDGLALLGFAPMTIVIAHRPLVRYLVQPRELEADDFAAKQQCTLSGRLAERYQAARTRDDRLLNWVYPTHPSWSTRAARQMGGSAQLPDFGRAERCPAEGRIRGSHHGREIRWRWWPRARGPSI